MKFPSNYYEAVAAAAYYELDGNLQLASHYRLIVIAYEKTAKQMENDATIKTIKGIRISPQDDGKTFYIPWYGPPLHGPDGDYGEPIEPIIAFEAMRQGAWIQVALNDPKDAYSHYETPAVKFEKI